MAPARIIDQIVSQVRRRLDERKSTTPLSNVVERAMAQPQPRELAEALRGPKLTIIAEVKRASPSKGALNVDLDARGLATQYVKAGASAVSVLTEQDHFSGSLQDLETVASVVQVPVLRKDFVVDPYQVWESRAYGADAVLLIVNILGDRELSELLSECQRAGLAALVEVHDEEELSRALRADAAIIGINNRNLSDFSVSLDTTRRLRPLVPPGKAVVSESGIRSRADVQLLERLGVHALLVGEALATAPEPAAKIRELLGSC